MKVTVNEKKTNPVLKREEIVVAIEYEGGPTPSLAALRTELAKLLNATEDRIEIAKLFTDTGRPAGRAWIRVWETAELVPKSKPKKAKAGAEKK
jgi:ribosomal protein S24E